MASVAGYVVVAVLALLAATLAFHNFWLRWMPLPEVQLKEKMRSVQGELLRCVDTRRSAIGVLAAMNDQLEQDKAIMESELPRLKKKLEEAKTEKKRLEGVMAEAKKNITELHDRLVAIKFMLTAPLTSTTPLKTTTKTTAAENVTNKATASQKPKTKGSTVGKTVSKSPTAFRLTSTKKMTPQKNTMKTTGKLPSTRKS